MKSFVLVVIVVCLAGLCCGCSNEQEELSGDQLELFNEVLESVTDAASVDGAIPKLEQLNTKLAALAARPAMKTRLTKEEREDGIKKYGRDLAKQGGAAAAHVVRISSIEGIKKEDVKRLQDTIKDIDLGG